MDALRYLIMTGMMHAMTEPGQADEVDYEFAQRGRSAVTGY